MKKIIKHILSFFLLTLMVTVSCNDWLDIYPDNSLPADKFYKTEADVEAMLTNGYYVLRNCVEGNLIPWGEFRSGCLTNSSGTSTNMLMKFEIKSSNTSYCSWTNMYQIINSANLVLKHAQEACDNDDTYYEEEKNSHLCEAYFLRALAYFYIVRNWRDAPLCLNGYDTDEESPLLPKSSDSTIIAQIKQDIYTAEQLDALKEVYETTWETKGRATKWSLYALMTDVCLWNSDFDEAITYADKILESNSSNAPRFLSSATHSSWFSIFNPGNSNESIFEIQWNHEKYDNGIEQTNNLPYMFSSSTNSNYSQYKMCNALNDKFELDYNNIIAKYNNQPEMAVRTLYGTYISGGYIWKYNGGESRTDERTTTYYDPNFIIYRVAEVMLMKAEALIMKNLNGNETVYQEALDLINQVRKRTNLDPDPDKTVTSSASELLQYVLDEQLKEFAGEGKSWYNILRLGRYPSSNGINFKNDFLISSVEEYNNTASSSWIRSVLSNENAWYLPITDNDIKNNSNLEQNPYYL